MKASIFAVILFQKDQLTLGQASILAGMNRLPFLHLLTSRKTVVQQVSARR